MGAGILFISLLFAFSGVFIALILFVLSKRTNTTGIVIIEFLFIVNIVYMIGYALELTGITVEAKLLFNHVQYIGMPMILPIWYMLCLQFYAPCYRWKLKNTLPFFIIPLVTLVFNWTPHSERLFLQRLHPF